MLSYGHQVVYVTKKGIKLHINDFTNTESKVIDQLISAASSYLATPSLMRQSCKLTPLVSTREINKMPNH